MHRYSWELYLVPFIEVLKKPSFLFDLDVIGEIEYLLYSSVLVKDVILKPRFPFPPFAFLTRIVMMFLPENRVLKVLAIAMVLSKQFHTQTTAIEIVQFHIPQIFLLVSKESR